MREPFWNRGHENIHSWSCYAEIESQISSSLEGYVFPDAADSLIFVQ